MNPQQFFSRLARKIATVSGSLSHFLYRTPDEARKEVWFRDGAEMTLRLDYDLDENSVVFDVGGYEGHWASDIFGRFCCTIYIFEPVKHFADGIAKRFERNKKIHSQRVGLAGESKSLSITVDAYASSTFKGRGESQIIELMDAVQFIDQHNIPRIDLMKVNIEGGEYELLERLIDTGYIERVTDLQVQFHDFVPDAETRMHGIQEKLRKTHATTYQYPFVWENWRLKQSTLTNSVPTEKISAAI